MSTILANQIETDHTTELRSTYVECHNLQHTSHEIMMEIHISLCKRKHETKTEQDVTIGCEQTQEKKNIKI